MQRSQKIKFPSCEWHSEVPAVPASAGEVHFRASANEVRRACLRSEARRRSRSRPPSPRRRQGRRGLWPRGGERRSLHQIGVPAATYRKPSRRWTKFVYFVRDFVMTKRTLTWAEKMRLALRLLQAPAAPSPARPTRPATSLLLPRPSSARLREPPCRGDAPPRGRSPAPRHRRLQHEGWHRARCSGCLAQVRGASRLPRRSTRTLGSFTMMGRRSRGRARTEGVAVISGLGARGLC